MRARRALAALAAIGAVALTAAPGAAAAPQSLGRAVPRATAAQPSVTVTLTSVGPVLLGPQSRLTVRGVVLNTGSQPVDGGAVRVRLRGRPLAGRDEVADWAAGDLGDGSAVTSPSTLPTLAPGGRTTFSFDLAASGLGLGPVGPRGLEVEVVSSPRSRTRLGAARSYVAWQPGVKEYAAQPLTFLVPVTGLPDAGADGVLDAEEAATAVGPGSRLRALVDSPWPSSVGWAVDPALLEALEAAGAPPVSSTGSGSDGASARPTPSAPVVTPTVTDAPDQPEPEPAAEAEARAEVLSFLADLRERAVSRTVVELPYADPDVVAVVRARRAPLLDATRAAAEGVVRRVLGVTPVRDVAWPADGWADTATLHELALRGEGTVVLDASTRPLTEPVQYPPAAKAQFAGLTALLYDPGLSSLLAGERPGTSVAATQRFLAETLAGTLSRPGESRHLLVAAPRTWTPDPSAVAQLMTAVAQAPWLAAQPLEALRSSPLRATTSSSRSAPAARPALARALLPEAEVDDVERLRARLEPVAALVGDPAVTAPTARAALTLVSSTWRGRPQARSVARKPVAQTVDRLQNGVRVLPSRVNFLANDGVVQVTVQNDLPVPVRDVGLRVRSGSPRLAVRQVPDRVAVEAGRRSSFQVPVRALASGQVRVTAQLTAPDGTVVGSPVDVTLRVRPTDSWAVWVLGGVAGVVLVVGVVRALRRPRRRAGTDPAVAPGTDPGADGASDPESLQEPVR